MSDPVSLDEARAFLRVTHPEEDGLIGLLIAAAVARVEAELGVVLDDASPAPLRLCVLWLVAGAYQNRSEVSALALPEVWVAPYREVRL